MSLSDRALVVGRFLRGRFPSIDRRVLRLCYTGWLALLLCCASNVIARAQTSTCANTTTTPPTYYYDAGGRLSAIMDATGKTSNYSYDLAGNILSITPNPSSTVQVLQVCPNQAPVGSAVTIWGTGFPSSVTVGFIGTSATNVTVVSANKIIATVPSGASKGNVSVTPSGGAKVSSTSSFFVGALPPQVTGFSGGTTVAGYAALNSFPFYGSASTAAAVAGGSVDPGDGTIIGSAASTQSLTISGTGFVPLTSGASITTVQDKVWLGGQAARVTGATSTSLTIDVPVSGSILKNGSTPVLTVLTPSGTATYSAQTVLASLGGVDPLIINNSSTGGSNIAVNAGVDTTVIDAATDASTVGGAQQSLTYASGSKYQDFVAYIFPATSGTFLNAQVSVCAPNATNCGKTGSTSGATNGAVLLIGPDGALVNAADLGGSYATTAGKYLPPSSASSTQEFWKLVKTGTYTLYVQNVTNVGSAIASVSLTQIPAAKNAGSVTLGSSNSTNVAGFQAATLTFNVPSGSSGRSTLTTSIQNVSASPYVVSVTAPDGFTQVYSNESLQDKDSTGFISPGSVDFSGPITTPATAAGTTYTISFQSLSPVSTSVTFALASLPNDVVATGCSAWPSSGSTVTCSGAISSAGQAVYANLAGTNVFSAGGAIGSLQTQATNFAGCYEVLLTDTGLGAQFYRSVQCGKSDFSYALTFPNGSVGPYLVQAFGLGENTGTLQFTLSTGSPLNVQTATVGSATPTTSTFTSAGQTQRIGFHPAAPGAGDWIQVSTGTSANCYIISATAQGSPTLQFESSPVPFATSMQCASGASGSLGLLQLPEAFNPSGTQTNNYNVYITPASAALGSVTTSLNAVAPPGAGTIPVNGTAYSTISASTTSFSLNFSPTIVTNGYVNLVTTPNIMSGVNAYGCYTVSILNSSGVFFNSSSQKKGYSVGQYPGCNTLNASGSVSLTGSTSPFSTSFILNNPQLSNSQSPSGNVDQALYNYGAVAAPAAIALVSAAPSGFSLPSTLPGQPVTASFTEPTANSYVNLVIGLDANLAAYSALITVTSSTAGVVYSNFVSDQSLVSGAILLPVTGSYQITVSPLGNAVGNVSVGVSSQ